MLAGGGMVAPGQQGAVTLSRATSARSTTAHIVKYVNRGPWRLMDLLDRTVLYTVLLYCVSLLSASVIESRDREVHPLPAELRRPKGAQHACEKA